MKHRLALSPLIALALAACATPPSTPNSTPDPAAAKFFDRSLDAADLRAFLVENLGQAPAAWDFEALSWVAFYYNPNLAVARAQWATARAARQTAGARPNPTISLVPGYNTTREPGISPWFPAINFDFLLQGNKRARQQDIAAADAEAARLAVLSAAWQVRSELRRALIDFNAASTRETQLHDAVVIQQRLAAQFAQRVSAGRASSSEESNARLASLKMEASAADASAQMAAARVRLAAVLGVPLAALDGKTFLPPPAPAFPVDQLPAARRESLQSRTDVLMALARFHSAHAALELEVAKQQPDLHLGPGYQWDQGANKWSLALTFELPIFHRNEGPIAEATARRDEALAQCNLAQAQAISAIDAAAAAQFAASAQLRHSQAAQDEAKAQAARIERRFELGAADQVDRELAAAELASAELALGDARTAAAMAAGQFEDALQLPFAHLATLADAAHPTTTRTP